MYLQVIQAKQGSVPSTHQNVAIQPLHTAATTKTTSTPMAEDIASIPLDHMTTITPHNINVDDYLKNLSYEDVSDLLSSMPIDTLNFDDESDSSSSDSLNDGSIQETSYLYRIDAVSESLPQEIFDNGW